MIERDPGCKGAEQDHPNEQWQEVKMVLRRVPKKNTARRGHTKQEKGGEDVNKKASIFWLASAGSQA